MKYQQPTFTLPTSSNKVTQEEWDRIFKPRNRRTRPRMKDLERAVDRATNKERQDEVDLWESEHYCMCDEPHTVDGDICCRCGKEL